ncbi:hypothetical protein KXD93_07625 [Mucilaginibacter sp. BJC16-A38]|uniref:hypothetical protein n=1 Tax=Mucilaginibacter phenanthrenivorans TaxID=1234842 RepID=UPI0021589CCE|nr:hypothetical protein [Mucilaginibacter phenanthrenivorans]MCR8557505.1 hypothetical protein [Mucilaginibacter phenanthrenivorans]
MRRKILFITGSINQTTQMHQISKHLSDNYDCWFSQLFPDSAFLKAVIKYTPFADGTVLKGQFRAKSENYLRQHDLQIDYGGDKNIYDLVVYCTDMVIANKFRQTKTIWVQEGMIDKRTLLTGIIKKLGLPPYFTGDTSLNGSTNICDVYCAASEGYKNYFAQNGTDAGKLIVTGLPNYDNHLEFINNDFPFRDYVMVATSDMRETYRFENRPAFIKHAVKIAAGRRLLFKLHPNEKYDRAEAEIRKYAPAGTMVYHSGNTNHMIANCCELVTQYSTVVYTGIALGKKVHSYFDVEELKRLAPIQNGGTSASNIAQVCSSFLEFEENKGEFVKQFILRPTPVEQTEVQYV